MDATHPSAADPVELVRRLDAEAIRNRLDALTRERDALRVLLRAALRTNRNANANEGEGGRRA
jgi:hypothetical protein